MDHFAGLDVSVKETSVCIVDDTGKIVREVKVASEPEALLALLKNPAYHFKRIGLEAGPLSQWLFSALAEAGLPVICVETRKRCPRSGLNWKACSAGVHALQNERCQRKEFGANALGPNCLGKCRRQPPHRQSICLVRRCGSVSARYRTVAHNALVSCLGREFSAFGLG